MFEDLCLKYPVFKNSLSLCHLFAPPKKMGGSKVLLPGCGPWATSSARLRGFGAGNFGENQPQKSLNHQFFVVFFCKASTRIKADEEFCTKDLEVISRTLFRDLKLIQKNLPLSSGIDLLPYFPRCFPGLSVQLSRNLPAC